MYLRSREIQQHLRARRLGLLLFGGLLAFLLELTFQARPPKLEAHHILITSTPSGADVEVEQVRLAALRLGQTARGGLQRRSLGVTPLRLALTRDSRGNLIDFPPRVHLTVPGFLPASLTLQPQGGKSFHTRLQPRWPQVLVWGSLHGARQHPWAALAALLASLGVLQFGFIWREERAWFRQERLRKQRGLQPGVEFAGYRLESQLGRGGMGRVLRARKLDTGEAVAIKILFESSSFDPIWRRRFQLEIDTLRRLQHPNVVLILDWGEIDEQLFLVQEYLEGEPLETRLAGGLTWEAVKPVAAQIAQGLSYLQSQGWVHRDLKPDNVMRLTNGRIKIVDFGIATPQSGGETSSIRGTPGYMAPEQLSGQSVDWRADLYSFGCILYEMLEGYPLFDQASHVMEVMRLHLEQPAPRLQTATPEVADFVARLLAKAPHERCSSPEEFQRLCRQLLLVPE